MPPFPNTNPAVSSMSLHDIIDTFWNEFKAFQNCTHPYHEPSRWETYDATKGNSYLWHEKYSIPFCDPNTGKSFLIWEQNMEFRRGRGNGWFLVGGCADDEDDNEAFTLEIACELIGETPQRDGVQMIHWNEEE